MSFVLQNDDMLDQFLGLMSLRTSLEELLDWDSDLVDFLIGAWSAFPITADSDRELMVSLYAAQLPHDKYEKFSKPLEQWVDENYNIFVR